MSILKTSTRALIAAAADRRTAFPKKKGYGAARKRVAEGMRKYKLPEARAARKAKAKPRHNYGEERIVPARLASGMSDAMYKANYGYHARYGR